MKSKNKVSLELVINDPRTGWANAVSWPVKSLREAYIVVNSKRITHKRFKFMLSVDAKGIRGKTFMWKRGKFFNIVDHVPVEVFLRGVA